jgi:MFS family permease
VGAVVGTIFGGIIGQRIYNRPGGRHAIAMVMGTTTALGALPGYFFLNVDDYGPHHVYLYASCLVGGVLAAVTPPNVRAVLLNVNPPETRGTMFALYTQMDDVGKVWQVQGLGFRV